MLEEHFYFACVYFLWQREEVAMEYCPRLLATGSSFPKFVLTLITRMLRRMVVRTLHGQVCAGRHRWPALPQAHMSTHISHSPRT